MARRGKDGLYKRGEFWWGWRRKHPGAKPERASTKCRDRQAARLVLAEWERTAADPVHYAANKTALEEAVVTFLADARRKGLAPPTLEMYKSKCGHITRILGKDRPLRSIVATTWDGYIAAREEEGASSHTIKKELIRGFGVLKAAKRRGLYPHDLSTVMPSYSARYVPRTRALTMDELQRLGRELRPDRLAHVAFVVATGCRLKESYRAKAEHLLDEGFVFLDGTKTKRARRTIPIAPPLRPFLDFAIANAPGAQVTEEAARRYDVRCGTDWLSDTVRPGATPAPDPGSAGSDQGRPFTEPGKDRPSSTLFPKWHSARRDILAACKRAGIEPCSWNDLRRSNATLLNHAGMTSADIGRLLGHVDGRMVETVYGQSTPESLRRALEASFEGTPAVQVAIESRQLPAKKGDSAPVNPGLRSRRSPVRSRGGAPRSSESAGDLAQSEIAKPSTLSTDADLVVYTKRTGATCIRDAYLIAIGRQALRQAGAL